MDGKDSGMGMAVLAHMGGSHMVILFPFAMMGAAVYFILIALRDGSEKRTSTPVLPTSPLGRRVHAALQPRPERPMAPPQTRLARRLGGPALQLMEGEAGEDQKARPPQRFQPKT